MKLGIGTWIWSCSGPLAWLVAGMTSAAVPGPTAYDQARDQAIESSREAHASGEARLEGLGEEAQRLLLDPAERPNPVNVVEAPPTVHPESAPEAPPQTFVGPTLPVPVPAGEPMRETASANSPRGQDGAARARSTWLWARQLRQARRSSGRPTLVTGLNEPEARGEPPTALAGPVPEPGPSRLLVWLDDWSWALRDWSTPVGPAVEHGAQPATRVAKADPASPPLGERQQVSAGPPPPGSSLALRKRSGGENSERTIATTTGRPPETPNAPNAPNAKTEAARTKGKTPPESAKQTSHAKAKTKAPKSRSSIAASKTAKAKTVNSRNPIANPRTMKKSRAQVAKAKAATAKTQEIAGDAKRAKKKTAKAKRLNANPKLAENKTAKAKRLNANPKLAEKKAANHRKHANAKPAKKRTAKSRKRIATAKTAPKKTAKSRKKIANARASTTKATRTRKGIDKADATARAKVATRESAHSVASSPASIAVLEPSPEVTGRKRADRPVEGWRVKARRLARREIDRAQRMQARLARSRPGTRAPQRVASLPPRRPKPAPIQEQERHSHDEFGEDDRDHPRLIEECDDFGCFVFEEVCDSTGCTHTEIGDVAVFFEP